MTRILIIDDEPIMHQTLADLMAGEAFELEFAADGSSGLAKAKANAPDIILLDLMMPGMNGYEVCTHLRADPLLAEVPIIMLTAYGDRKSRLRGIGVGADDFIAKPFDSLELLTRLRTVARLNRYRRLMAERTRFRWALEHSDDGFLIVDLAGSLLYANQPARLYLGIAPEAALPADEIMALARQSYRLEPAAGWSGWPEQPLGDNCYLVRPETPTAPAFWLSVHEQRFATGDAAQVVVQLRDITALVATRTDMRSFRTVLAHKLRTPMNATLGWLDFILESLDDLPAPELRTFVGNAHTGAVRLNAAVHDVLAYVESLSVRKDGTTLAIAELPAVVESVSATLGLEDVALQISVPADGLCFPITPSAMEQILYELLENSQKFHPARRPSVRVTVTAAASAPNPAVYLTVVDDGLTLSPQQIKWAMTPYLQGEKDFTGETPGMGLGLALVAALVWQVGGELRVSNRAGGPGVSVELRLPVREQVSRR